MDVADKESAGNSRGVVNMIVYAEYLFLENFITGLMLLFFTWKMIRKTGECAPSWKRMLYGALLCGGSGFLLFLNCGTAGAVAMKILSAGAVCIVTFGRQRLLKKIFLFLSVSFLSGGIAMAVFLWLEIPALAGNGVLYLNSMTWIKLFLCGLPAMAAADRFIEMIHQKRSAELVMGTAEVELDGCCCSFPICIDSGNSLREPITGRPVILIDRKGAYRLPFRKEEYPERFTAVPFQSVGVKQGILDGLRLDLVRYKHREWKQIVLAYYDGNFPGFEVLLHRDMIEGGVLEDDDDVFAVAEGDIGTTGMETEAEKCVLHRRK